MGSFVGQRSGFVGCDALVEMAETAAELSDRACGEVTQIALGELRVLAADPDLATEGEVVADEHASTSDESSRVGLVVAVAQPDDPSDIGCFALRDADREHAKIARTLMTESVSFLLDAKAAGFQLSSDFPEDGAMTQRKPCAGSSGSWHGEEFLAADDGGSTVKKHSTRRSLDARLRVFDDLHDMSWVRKDSLSRWGTGCRGLGDRLALGGKTVDVAADEFPEVRIAPHEKFLADAGELVSTFSSD